VPTAAVPRSFTDSESIHMPRVSASTLYERARSAIADSGACGFTDQPGPATRLTFTVRARNRRMKFG